MALIDGIDVTKCEYYGNCDNRNCEGDCYYKQLKRAEQEHEKLKAEIKNLINKPVFLPNIEEKATNKFRQALEEIMEIAQTNTSNSLCEYCDGVGISNGCQDVECSYYQMNNILNKIDEVLNDRN